MKNCLCLNFSFLFYFLNKLKEGIFITFFFFISAFSITNREIIEESMKYFQEKPGFDITLNCICKKNRSEEFVFRKNYWGHLFELETALYYSNILKDEILGFSLEIGIYSDIGLPFVELYLDNSCEPVFLRQTEFDIITKSYCIECKSGKQLKHKKNYKQFKKEIDMIRLFRSITEELKNNTIVTEVVDGKLKLNGILTAYKDIYLRCNWIGLLDSSGFEINWDDIVRLLSQMQFKIVLKHFFGSDLLKKKLEEYCFLHGDNFVFDENLSY